MNVAACAHVLSTGPAIGQRHVDQVAAEVRDRGPAHARGRSASRRAMAGSANSSDSHDGPPEPELADGALGDHLLHERHRGQPPVVEADRVAHPGGGDRGRAPRPPPRRSAPAASRTAPPCPPPRPGSRHLRRACRAGCRCPRCRRRPGRSAHASRSRRRARRRPPRPPRPRQPSRPDIDGDHRRHRQAAQHRRDPVAVAVRLAHHPVADDADPHAPRSSVQPSPIAAVTCSAAVSAGDRVLGGGARARRRPRRTRAKLSAWRHSASSWARSPSAGSMTSHRSLPRVPNTSARTASPAG